MTVILGGIATCLLSCYLVYKVSDRSYRQGSGLAVGLAILLMAVGVGLGLCAVVGRLLGWI